MSFLDRAVNTTRACDDAGDATSRVGGRIVELARLAAAMHLAEVHGESTTDAVGGVLPATMMMGFEPGESLVEDATDWLFEVAWAAGEERP